MFGFAGAHRSGKTTLAKAVAERLDFPFYEASFSRFARQIGVDAVSALPLDERIDVQERCLDLYVAELAQAPRFTITDRTPIDMLAYMLAEVTMHNTSEELGKRINNYADRCLHETSRRFDTIIVTRPLPSYVLDPKSPAPNLGYQWQIHYLVHGAIQAIRRYIIEATLISFDLNERIEASVELFASRANTLGAQKEQSKLH